MQILFVAWAAAVAGSGVTGGLWGLPQWLTSLIVQLPFVALFWYLYSRERKERITLSKEYTAYLKEQADKLITHADKQRDAWGALEGKIDAVLAPR